MPTTEKKPRVKKPRVKKPPAEIVGSFKDVMRRDKCEDGRALFMFHNGNTEKFIFAASELQAWKAIHSELGTMEKMTLRMIRRKMSELYRMSPVERLKNGDAESQD